MSSPAWERRRRRTHMMQIIRMHRRMVRRNQHRMHLLSPPGQSYIRAIAFATDEFDRSRLTR